MKSILTLVLGFAFVSCSYGQEFVSVLEAPADWDEEQFPIPPGFAQEIDFEGMEDLRFSPGWRDSTSKEFWAYTFVWYVEYSGALTDSTIEHSLNLYYDGLMGTDSAGENRSALPSGTRSVFEKKGDVFFGEVHTFDRFFGNKPITLFIKVSAEQCEKLNTQMIRFDIAAADFEDEEAWRIFEEVKQVDVCNTN